MTPQRPRTGTDVANGLRYWCFAWHDQWEDGLVQHPQAFRTTEYDMNIPVEQYGVRALGELYYFLQIRRWLEPWIVSTVMFTARKTHFFGQHTFGMQMSKAGNSMRRFSSTTVRYLFGLVSKPPAQSSHKLNEHTVVKLEQRDMQPFTTSSNQWFCFSRNIG